MAIDQHLLLIKNVDLFSQMSDDLFGSMNLIHHFKTAKKNDFIYFEAHLHNALYFLKDGYVKIGYYDNDGQEVIKEIIGKGDVFGQVTLLPNNLEGEFAQAYKSDVSLCMFTVQDFESILKQHPAIAFHFTRQLGQKMLRVENRMINLLQKTITQRLLLFLLNLVRQYPEYHTHNRFCMPNIFATEDIARLLGSTRQTVSTLLNAWEREGWCLLNKQWLIITDVKLLQNKLSVG